MREKWTSWAKQSLVGSRCNEKKKRKKRGLHGYNRDLLLEDWSKDEEQMEMVTSLWIIKRSADQIKPRMLSHSRLRSHRLTDGFQRGTMTREALWDEKSKVKRWLFLKVTHWLRFRSKSLLRSETERRYRAGNPTERIPGWKKGSKIKRYLDRISFPDFSFLRKDVSQRWAGLHDVYIKSHDKNDTLMTQASF